MELLRAGMEIKEFLMENQEEHTMELILPLKKVSL
jgi:hypothetical protein